MLLHHGGEKQAAWPRSRAKERTSPGLGAEGAARPLRGRFWHLPSLHGQCATRALHVPPGAAAVAKYSQV